MNHGLKVGDRVVIKEWDEMVEDYGIAENYGEDCLENGFVESMKYLCGETCTIRTITEDISGIAILGLDFDDAFGFFWEITSEMVKKIDDNQCSFTKDMFKSGMRVETRDGCLYLVIKDCETMVHGKIDMLCAFDKSGYMSLDSYDDDLKCKHMFFGDEDNDAKFDIMAIYDIDGSGFVNGDIMDETKLFKIWERKQQNEEQKHTSTTDPSTKQSTLGVGDSITDFLFGDGNESKCDCTSKECKCAKSESDDVLDNLLDNLFNTGSPVFGVTDEDKPCKTENKEDCIELSDSDISKIILSMLFTESYEDFCELMKDEGYGDLVEL
jgi:hypothetical protein